MARQLNLDRDKLDQCYELASHVVSHVHKFIQRHSSKAVERATLVLLGVEESYRGLPLASCLVDSLTKDELRLGAAYWWGRALLNSKEGLQDCLLRLARKKLRWQDLPQLSPAHIQKETRRITEEKFHLLDEKRKSLPPFSLNGKEISLAVFFRESKPRRFYSFVRDWFGKERAVDLAAIEFYSKRDFEDFWIEEELKAVWETAQGHPIIPVTEGLVVPEQTVLALKMGFNALRLDGLTPALLSELEIKRSLTDHHFALLLCGRFGIKILSGHARIFEGSETHWKTSQVLASLLLFEQFAKRAGIPFEDMMLSMPIRREEKELAILLSLTQLVREMFSKSVLMLRFFEPMHPFHFFLAALTEQNVLEFVPDHFSNAAGGLKKQMAGLAQELFIQTHGKISREAHSLLEQTWRLLKEISHLNLWNALEKNVLTPSFNKGVELGKEGIFQKSYHYWNPVVELLEERCQESASS